MPTKPLRPTTEHINTVLKTFTASARGPTVLRVNDTRVELRPREGEPTLVLQAHICTLPMHSTARAALCEALLQGNTQLPDSDRLGIDAGRNAAVYQRVVDIDIDPEALGHELWDLIDATEQFRFGLGND